MKYIIIGAGLSGLTTAHELLKAGESDFLILEAKSKAGGRMITQHGVDLGAAWFQNYHVHLNKLLSDLALQSFDQFNQGKSVLIHNSMAPAHYFEMNPDEPPAQRIQGGSAALIEELASKLETKLRFNTEVHTIKEAGDEVEILTSQSTLKAKKVIVTIPPKLANELSFYPELPEATKAAMADTHTWMSNSIKVGLTFRKPFWREKGLSGTVISQISPVVELYDHSNAAETEFSLMGFVNERMRDESAADRKEHILAYLEKHLGAEVRNHQHYIEKDWSQEKHTATKNLKPVYMHPQYGHPLLKKPYMNEKLYFSGTETSPNYGGYMEGAVISGQQATKLVMG